MKQFLFFLLILIITAIGIFLFPLPVQATCETTESGCGGSGWSYYEVIDCPSRDFIGYDEYVYCSSDEVFVSNWCYVECPDAGYDWDQWYTGSCEYRSYCACTSHYTYSCYDNDVYWYDSCGYREEKKEECYDGYYTGNYRCSGSMYQAEYRYRGCSGSSCYDYYGWVNWDDCTDCSCSCGGYNVTESTANGNCADGKDNDCDGYTDSADSGCAAPAQDQIDCKNECVRRGYPGGECYQTASPPPPFMCLFCCDEGYGDIVPDVGTCAGATVGCMCCHTCPSTPPISGSATVGPCSITITPKGWDCGDGPECNNNVRYRCFNKGTPGVTRDRGMGSPGCLRDIEWGHTRWVSIGMRDTPTGTCYRNLDFSNSWSVSGDQITVTTQINAKDAAHTLDAGFDITTDTPGCAFDAPDCTGGWIGVDVVRDSGSDSRTYDIEWCGDGECDEECGETNSTCPSDCPPTNNPPTCSAGSDKTVNENQSVQLDCSASDPDGDSLTYSWSCTGGSLNNSSILQPTYTAPSVSADTDYTCTLNVDDGKGGICSDSMIVHVINIEVCPESSATCSSPDGSIPCGGTESDCLYKTDWKYYGVPDSAGKEVTVTLTMSGTDCNLNDLYIYDSSCSEIWHSTGDLWTETWTGTPDTDIIIGLGGDSTNENCLWDLSVDCEVCTGTLNVSISGSGTCDVEAKIYPSNCNNEDYRIKENGVTKWSGTLSGDTTITRSGTVGVGADYDYDLEFYINGSWQWQDNDLNNVCSETPNEPPTCNYLDASPTSGDAPLTVSFTGSGSDSDGDIVEYQLDFDGDGTWDYTGSVSPPEPNPVIGYNYTYNTPNIYTAKIRFKDDDDAWSDIPTACTQVISVTEPGVVINPPVVTTNEANPVETTSATLNGSLIDLGYDLAECPSCSCIVWFEWGTTPSYGNSTPVEIMTSPGNFSYTITNLDDNATYFFEAFAKNGGSW